MQPVNWTLVGDVKSGKSYFVYTALRALSSSSSVPLFIPEETNRILNTRMTEHIRKGKLDSTSAEIIAYRFDQKAPGAPDRREVCIVDGPGLALHPDLVANDAISQAVASSYREAAFGSDALVVMLPLPSSSAPDTTGWQEVVLQFVGSLHQHADPRLKRIAVCVSKVDSADDFEAAAASGSRKAFAQAVLARADRGSRVVSAIRNFRSLRAGLQVAFFPVSSFGIVRGTNRRNVIPGTDLPLVNHIRFDFLQTCLDTPLYPRPFREDEVGALWKPFNVEAPFKFLLTGALPDGSGILLEELVASD